MAEAAKKLLCVEDNPADAAFIEELLYDVAPGGFEVVSCERLSDALEHVGKTVFDAVLLDLQLPDSQGMDTFLELHGACPDVPIIVVTGLGDESVGVTAVREGAQDYLVKGQFGGQSLVRAIRFAITRSQTQTEMREELERAERGRVLGLLGSKGGVGTTSAVIEFAAVLAGRGKSVVVAEIGARPAALAVRLGQAPVDTLTHLARIGADGITKREVRSRLVRVSFEAQVLFGPHRQDECEETGPDVAAAVVDLLAEMAQFILIDLGSRCCELVKAAALRCDHVVVVTHPGPVGIKLGKSTVDVLKSWGLDDERVMAVVVNPVPGLAQISTADLSSSLRCTVMGVIPPDADGYHSAELRRVPLVVDQPDSLPAKSIADIVRRLAPEKAVPLFA